ncbi:MAG: DNA polymerase III subunit delta [Chloroflexota bacterium]|nr:MAG: DNA polymerase III subunit delta [Chloroflexota bacterium]
MIHLVVTGIAGGAHLDRLKAALGDPATAALNTTTLDADRLQTSDLASACESMPFLSNRRLVLVRGIDGKAAGRVDTLAWLVEYLDRVPETTDLAFLVDGAAPDALAPAIARLVEAGRAIVIRDAILDESSAILWLRSRAREQGGAIGANAAAALVQAVGVDSRALAHELDKLISASGDVEISPAMVGELVVTAFDARVWDLTDAFGSRNGSAIARAWRRLRAQGEDSHRLLPLIARQVRLIVLTLDAGSRGVRPDSLAGYLGVSPGIARKAADQSRRWSPARARSAYGALVAADWAEKSGQGELDDRLESLLAEIVGSRV